MDRLLLDTMLGKLATYLRMCGYDAAYALDEGVESDDALLAVFRLRPALLAGQPLGRGGRDARRPVAYSGPPDRGKEGTNVGGTGCVRPSPERRCTRSQ